MMRLYMNWGGILGFALIAVSVVFYVLGMTESKAVQWLSYSVLAAGIYLGSFNEKSVTIAHLFVFQIWSLPLTQPQETNSRLKLNAEKRHTYLC